MRDSPELYPVILRVLVGSRAHGVANESSDFDYREVFVIPATHLLQVPRSARPKMAWADEHRATDDEGGWEIEPFLEMCLRGHPNAIELLRGPIETCTPDGEALRALLPQLLSRRAVCESHLGYAKNARHKLLDKEQIARNPKWAATYLRVLWQGAELVATGELTVSLVGTEVHEAVLRARAGTLSPYEVLALADPWERALVEARSDASRSVLRDSPDIDAINKWLLELRQRVWE